MSLGHILDMHLYLMCSQLLCSNDFSLYLDACHYCSSVEGFHELYTSINPGQVKFILDNHSFITGNIHPVPYDI